MFYPFPEFSQQIDLFAAKRSSNENKNKNKQMGPN